MSSRGGHTERQQLKCRDSVESRFSLGETRQKSANITRKSGRQGSSEPLELLLFETSVKEGAFPTCRGSLGESGACACGLRREPRPLCHTFQSCGESVRLHRLISSYFRIELLPPTAASTVEGLLRPGGAAWRGAGGQRK